MIENNTLMKNIALLAPDFSVEHCQDFIKGVLQYYEKCPDINVFVTQTLFGYDFKGIFMLSPLSRHFFPKITN